VHAEVGQSPALVRHDRHLRAADVPVLPQRQRQGFSHVHRQRRHQFDHRQLGLCHTQQPQETGQTSAIVATFRVSHGQREMYTPILVTRVYVSVCLFLCVCLSVCLSVAASPHYCTDPDVIWRYGRECSLVVHYWANLQSVHGFRCCHNIAPMQNVNKCLYWLYYSVA